MRAFSPDLFQNRTKSGGLVLLFVLVLAILVAIAQSVRFASSLRVVAEFGFQFWQLHITRMLDHLWPWAIVGGFIFASGILAQSGTAPAKKILAGAAVSFVLGIAVTFLFVLVAAVIFYVPLGILSFVFPNQVEFFSMGFAFLCASYLVFIWIAMDAPRLLFELIKTAGLYFKLLIALVALLLVFQIASTLLSILIILTENSFWRHYLPAFILTFGGTLVLTLLLNLVVWRKGSYARKVWLVILVYVLSILAGNISQSIFRWGEYPAAVTAAVVGPAAFTYLFNRRAKEFLTALSAASGLLCGLGIGLTAAALAGLRIIAQAVPGTVAALAISSALGAAFGFILGPRLGDAIMGGLNINPKLGAFVSVGLVVGIIAGAVIGAFLNK